MDVYVLEHKHFHAGIKITEDGEFLRWNNYQKTYEGMASPLEQNERHIQVLKDVMAQIELPTRLGVRIPPSLRSEEHTSELQSLMRISYAVFCLKKKQQTNTPTKRKRT